MFPGRGALALAGEARNNGGKKKWREEKCDTWQSSQLLILIIRYHMLLQNERWVNTQQSIIMYAKRFHRPMVVSFTLSPEFVSNTTSPPISLGKTFLSNPYCFKYSNTLSSLPTCTRIRLLIRAGIINFING